MKTFPVVLAIFICACLALPAKASPGFAVDQNEDGRADQWYEVTEGRVAKMSLDRNYDERIDYGVEFDREERKLHEELDFDFDGRMDDFYFFERGELVRQEIDSNFDDRIDIWVFLQGPYIERYEMDRDFDGVVDVKKDFGR